MLSDASHLHAGNGQGEVQDRPSRRWAFARRLDADIHTKRAAFFADALTPHITPSSSMLDVGAGDGLLAATLRDRLRLNVHAVDIEARSLGNLQVEVYDGKTLPLADQSVDYSICVAVLHHCDDPVAVLREIRRVTRKRLLLVEDLFDSFTDRVGVIGFHHYLRFVEKMPFNPDGFASTGRWRERLFEAGLRMNRVVVLGKAVRWFPVVNTLLICDPL